MWISEKYETNVKILAEECWDVVAKSGAGKKIGVVCKNVRFL